MCCFFAALVFFGPRVGILVAWLFPAVQRQMSRAFGGFNFPWLVAILGIVFVPWATLMYLIVYPVSGFDWVWIALGVFADLAGWIGGDRNRARVPGYSTVAPYDPTPPPAAPSTTP